MFAFKLTVIVLLGISVCEIGLAAVTDKKKINSEIEIDPEVEDDTSHDDIYMTMCKNLVNVGFFKKNGEGRKNMSRAYQMFTPDIIKNHIIDDAENSELQNETIEMILNYYEYIFKNHQMDFEHKDDPQEFCEQKSLEVFESLSNDKTKKKNFINISLDNLANICNDLMKAAGISKLDTANAEVAFEIFYFKLNNMDLTYEGLTGISVNDESVDKEIEAMKLENTTEYIGVANNHGQGFNLKRRIAIHPKFETTDRNRMQLNYHTKNERHILDFFIQTFLYSYFYYFANIINGYDLKAFVNVSVYCAAKGIQLMAKLKVPIPEKSTTNEEQKSGVFGF